jgi:phosphoenolpyruvate carboxykinase (ATP)
VKICEAIEIIEIEKRQRHRTMNTGTTNQDGRLIALGLKYLGRVYWNLSTPSLYEEAIRRYEGLQSHLDPLVVRSGQFTGRAKG